MEQLVIPGWAVFIMTGLGTILLGWLVWLTLRTMENKSAIELNTAADKTVSLELEKIYEAISLQSKTSNDKFDKMEDTMDSKFDKMDKKIDLFLSEEMALLKQLIPRQ